MTPQERELLTGLFDRLRQCDRNAREPDAERFIAQAVAAQPSAPYFMAQLLLVQDQALSAAQARISQLEHQAEAARAQPAAPARSFLADAPTTGPWGAYRPTVAPQVAPASTPLAAGSTLAQSGGGFLRGALQTAAGVAGGALLFEGIGSLLRHSGAGWGGGFLPTGGTPTLVEETVINEYGHGGVTQPLETGADGDPGSLTQAAGGDEGFLTPAADDAGDDADWAGDQDGDLI